MATCKHCGLSVKSIGDHWVHDVSDPHGILLSHCEDAARGHINGTLTDLNIAEPPPEHDIVNTMLTLYEVS